ncbi:MAG: patatin-like phospholipase family protein [Rubrivivax sp.]|nr:patatin-like phospholipase family protein [Rubrivivax sp.]
MVSPPRRWPVLLAVAALLACAEQPATLPTPGEEPFLAPVAAPVRLALVLSSGALRGLAHVGVLRALERAGIRPDLIVGSSVGALVGAINASGASGAEIGLLVGADDFDFGKDWMNPAADRPKPERLSICPAEPQASAHRTVPHRLCRGRDRLAVRLHECLQRRRRGLGGPGLDRATGVVCRDPDRRPHLCGWRPDQSGAGAGRSCARR